MGGQFMLWLNSLLSGEDAEVCSEADTDGDGKVGANEAVFVLRMLAE